MIKIINNKPNIETITKYYKNKGIVGEESVYILATLGLLAGNSFSVEGRSGSGKTKIAEALRELLPYGSVYSFDTSSDKAIIRDAGRVNGSKVLYVPEMQNALNNNYKTVIEMLKCLCEGRDFNYPVTIGGKQVEFKIKGDITFYTTLADQNEFEKKIEYTRRMFQLFTRIDDDIKDRLLKEKARRRYIPSSDLGQLSEHSLTELKKHAKSILYMPSVRVINVFSDYIDSLVPRENEMVDAFIDKYYDLNDASGKFHYPQRIMKKINGEPTVFLNIDDIRLIHELYPGHFFRSLSELDKKHAYEEDSVAKFKDGIDWQKCFDLGVMRMKEYYSPIVNSWVKMQRLDENSYNVNDSMDFDEWEKKFMGGSGDLNQKKENDYEFRIRLKQPISN